MALKMNNGTIFFNNVGEPPMGWQGEVTDEGNTLTATGGEEYTWDDEERCYICREPEPPAEVKRLYIYPTGTFGIIAFPVNVPTVVGNWNF